MKNYHLQVKYELEGWEGQYPNDELITSVLLDWTNIETAHSFKNMEMFKVKDKLLKQSLRMISFDEKKWFYIGVNVLEDYPHKVSDLHTKRVEASL